MKNLLVFIFCLSATVLDAQDLDVSGIPDSLIQNASVVKRYEEIILEIQSPGKYLLHERHVYTILKDDADSYSSLKAYYDQFTKIDYLAGTLYNSGGKAIKKVKEKEMKDYAYQTEDDMVSDDRYLSNDFNCRDYPYTVDYEQDVTKDGVLNFKDWTPQESPDMSLQYSKYVIIAPIGYQVRYKELNFSEPPKVTTGKDKITYSWEMRNIPAKKFLDEDYVADYHLPSMMVAPSEFKAQGYSGNMSTWDNYGKFIYTLKKGKDSLPEDLKKQVHQLTDHLQTPMDKIRVLYQYLQNNTHYISIQLGIGGWQPFSAQYVASKKYGDCKALSNFMVALLKEAGIEGKYVEIKAGNDAEPVQKDFSESQFDHVICCVPLKNDTVWLECTSSYYPAGYLGSFTSNRWGILIDKNGGTLVHTPDYTCHENQKISHISVTLDDQGNFSGKVNTSYEAEASDNLSQILASNSDGAAKDYIRKGIDLPTFEIQNLNFTQIKKRLPVVKANYQLTASNYAQVSGKRIFILPDILSRMASRLLADSQRIYDVTIHHGYTTIDSVSINIPEGYTVEMPFKDQELVTKFGTYSAHATVVSGKIIFYRKRVVFSGDFSASDYNAMVAFDNEMFQSDHSRIVLVKQ